MNEPHDPDEWQDEGDPHPIALLFVQLFVYVLYVAAVYALLG